MIDLDSLYMECQQEAIAAGALEPHGLLENMGAGIMAYNYESFADTVVARNRLHEWTLAIMRRKGYIQ